VLKFGTVSWELNVIKTHDLDKKQGVNLEVLELAGKSATSVALQAEEVDMIVTDWVWVARQRAEGANYTFVPYSTALGALMVPADSQVRTLAELEGKRVGIAGGPLDKSWLLLRALASKRHGIDLDRAVDKVFAAPPLLNEQILAGRVDAVLNYWHFAARLQAAGLRRVMGVEDVIKGLGVDTEVPLVGYAFKRAWANVHREDVLGFVRATREAKAILAESDAEWERLRPLMQVEDETAFRALRDSFREGIPRSWGKEERADAERLFAILAELGGERLVGRAETLEDGTFWPHVTY
jgi:NitT/TauT family transport system substrate-binding protein